VGPEVGNGARSGRHARAAAVVLLASAVALVGCERRAVEKGADSSAPSTAVASSVGASVGITNGAADASESANVVDSIFPMEVMLERFRAGLTEPKTLAHGVPTRDALIAELVRALEANDTASFERIAVDQAEFAWLFFPTNAMAKPPYELPPALAWFRLQEGNRKGVFRALRDLGGHDLGLAKYDCPAAPQVEGRNRIWAGCTLTIARGADAPVTLRLFESILERDGRFAFLSYANDL
jgi:hypothetical protein